LNGYDPHAIRQLIEFLERQQANLKADMHREFEAMRKDISSLQESNREHDRTMYVFYGAALAAWSAIEIGLKLLDI
jgi:hypothetical protein